MSDWAPFAVRRDGPAWKVGYSYAGEAGPKRGDVKHSAEGYWPGLYSVLDGPRRASWHFTVGFGRIEQHYPLSAHCWHAGDVDDDGGVAANIDLIGDEHLGVAGEPLTPYQVDGSALISRWAAEQNGLYRFARYPTQNDVWTLAEHNQVSDVPTACPSNRILWEPIFAALQPPEVEDDMKPFLAWDVDEGRVYLIGPWGASWIVEAGDVETFKELYGDLTIALRHSTIQALGEPAII